jgi:predicted nuclease of predicted toxin-antitoxin system
VQTVPQEQPAGRDDAVIFKAACDEERILWTQDLDFSDVRTFSPGTHPGVVLVRLREPSRRRLVERVRQILASESLESWAGCFIVISDHKLRIRRPPPPPPRGSPRRRES